MRENYNKEGGVEGYYASAGASYSNPHFHAIVQATALIMDELLSLITESCSSEETLSLRVLDLACGSGEATLAIKNWLQNGTRRKSMTKQSYQPPPQSRLEIMFLACDPFTQEAYLARTGSMAEKWSFEDISNGVADEQRFHLTISSYALHVASPSTLYTCLLQLSFISSHLIILSPHKNPETALVERGGHWRLVKSLVHERVHAWLYESQGMQQEVREVLDELMKGG